MVRLLKEERQQSILEEVHKHKRVTVPELSQIFGISEVTIRRDLHELSVSGKLQRTHRGAIETLAAVPEPPVIQRMALTQDHKLRICRAAADLVVDGDSVFLGSGSTTTLLARELAGRGQRLTVITNAITVAMELAAGSGNISVVLTGGMLREPELSVLGHITEQALREVQVSKIFMGVQALSLDGGWSTDHLPEVSTTRAILEMSPRLIILADHTKLNRRAAAYIAPAVRITQLITDWEADPAFVSQAAGIGIHVLQV